MPLNYAAEESGFNVIGRIIDGVPNFQTNVIVTKRSWAEKNRTLTVRFMRGMVQAMRWLPENKEPAVEFLSREMQLKRLFMRARGGNIIRKIVFGRPTVKSLLRA